MSDAPTTLWFTDSNPEQGYSDALMLYEREIEPSDDGPGEWVVHEHSVFPPEHHLPTTGMILDQIIEWANDNGEIDEAMSEQFADAAASQAVVEWTDCLRNLIAADVTYRMACGELGTHRLRRHDDGTLTLDGEVLVQ